MLLPGKKYSAQANARAIKAALSGCVNQGVSRYGQDVCVDAMEEDRRVVYWDSFSTTSSTTANYMFRYLIPAAVIAGGGKRVSVTLYAGNTTWVIAGASIGIQASSGNLTDMVAPVRLTFSGSEGVSITTYTATESDFVDLEFTENDSLVIHLECTSGTQGESGVITDKGVIVFYKNGLTGAELDSVLSGMTPATPGYTYGIQKITVSGSTYDSTTDTASGSDLSLRTPLAYYSEAGVVSYPFGQEKARRLIDSYAFSNVDNDTGLNTGYSKRGMRFTLSEDTYITNARVMMLSSGTVSGETEMHIYSLDGSGLPTGNPMLTGTPIQSTQVPTSRAALTSVFSGHLKAGTYHLVAAFTGSGSVSLSYKDGADNDHAYYTDSSGLWTLSASSFAFELYGYTASDRRIRRLTVAALDDTTGKLQARASLDGGVTWTPRKVMRDQGLSKQVVDGKDITVNGGVTASDDGAVFDGSTGYLTATYDSDFTFEGDFRIEMDLYLNASPTVQTPIFSTSDNAATLTGVLCSLGWTSGKAALQVAAGGSWSPSISTFSDLTIPTLQWFNIAWGRTGSTVWCEVDGVQSATTGTKSGTLTGSVCFIGWLTSYSGYLDGNMRNLKVTNDGEVVFDCPFLGDLDDHSLDADYHAHTIDLDVAHLSGSAPVYEIITDSADHAIRGAAMLLE